MKNYRFKRIFVIVADSMGSGYLPDADKFGDKRLWMVHFACASDWI